MISIQQREFTKLTVYLKENFGINLSKKKNLIEGRLSNYLMENGYENFEEYLEAVFSDQTGREMVNLINRLTTNHTYFMREWKSLEYYRDTILPPLSQSLSSRDLRVWSAGCSSGEEPYTLAMIHRDFFGAASTLWDTTVLATDISLSVLEKARLGRYSEDAMKVLPGPWLLNYFRRMPDGTFRVSDELQKAVVFRAFNLISPFPFRKPFHTIFCRNVMIYFDQQTKIELVRKFYDSLVPGGYLIIGQSESIDRENSDFRYVMPSIYRKE